jgi:signal transduction histidine kinase
VEAQREAGVLEERGRLSREIHDTLAQGFSSIVLLARAAGEDGTAAGRRGELVDQIRSTAADNLGEARRIVAALAPPDLAEHGLAAALGRLLAALHTATGVETDLRVEGGLPPMPTAAEVTLLRVAQSALANVRAHSGAGRVVVTLSAAEGEVRMDVLDDGRGFDATGWAARPGPSEAGGYGLRAMRARLRAAGGDLEVESEPGEGTVVSASLPVPGPGTGQEQS